MNLNRIEKSLYSKPDFMVAKAPFEKVWVNHLIDCTQVTLHLIEKEVLTGVGPGLLLN